MVKAGRLLGRHPAVRLKAPKETVQLVGGVGGMPKLHGLPTAFIAATQCVLSGHKRTNQNSSPEGPRLDG